MRKSPKSQQITVLFSWSLPLCYKSKEKAPHSKISLLFEKSKGASAKQQQLYHSRADGLHLCLYR